MNNQDLTQIELDPTLLEQMNKKSDHDVFLLKIAEIFQKVVLSFGIETNTAELAKNAFYAMRSDQDEESKVDNRELRQINDQRLIQSLTATFL